MSSVIRLHHPDEVPTAVLENKDKQWEAHANVSDVDLREQMRHFFSKKFNFEFISSCLI